MGRDWVKLRRVYCAFASCLTERVGGGGGGTVSRVNSERVGGRGVLHRPGVVVARALFRR